MEGINGAAFHWPYLRQEHHPYADQATARPHNTKLFNLCLIKKIGLDQWAKDKALNVKKHILMAHSVCMRLIIRHKEKRFLKHR
jgi:hypothetical protein